MILGLGHKYIQAFLMNALKNPVANNLIVIISAIIGIIVVTAFVITLCIFTATKKRPTDPATVIVLGCKVYGNKASLMLEERLYAALDYLKINPSSHVIVAGGKGDDEGISEAECMYNWLVDHGINPMRIHMESKSTTTYENLIFAFEIIMEQKLNPNIAITSNDFHLYRALKLVNKCKSNETVRTLIESDRFSYGAISAPTAWWLFPTYFVRELYAVLALWLGLKK
ncbi:MAG: YdcF family protein [Lachnospiraceae bacterium]|nr:YdcF family protein [Lachnospiraceae bacterium]